MPCWPRPALTGSARPATPPAAREARADARRSPRPGPCRAGTLTWPIGKVDYANLQYQGSESQSLWSRSYTVSGASRSVAPVKRRKSASWQLSQPVFAHQSLDRAPRHLDALAAQLLVDAPGPVDPVIGLVHVFDLLEQDGVALGAGRRRAAFAAVVGARAQVQHPAHRLDPEAVAKVVDHRDYFVRDWPSSAAKNVLAAMRSSLARLSSLFSRRSRLSSSRSAVVSCSGRLPASAWACRTQVRSDSRWMPRSAAICAIGRSDSSASRTARYRSSWGYFRGSAIAVILLPTSQDHDWLEGLH